MATPVEVLEGNSCVFEVSFKDENDAGVTPTSIVWSLFNEQGEVLEGFDSVEVTPVGDTVNILLDETATTLNTKYSNGRRVLKVKATYTSEQFGTMSIQNSIAFTILNIVD